MQTTNEFALKEGIINEETILLAKIKLEECYEKINEVIDYYMDIPEDRRNLIAVWIIGTYFQECFNTFPYLYFNAMRGSGKTRMLKLISALGAKGDDSIQNNLTEAVLFRIPRGTTTCIDEIEQIGSKEKQTLRELLNSAYKKGMKVKRMRKVHSKDGEMQVTETFQPYFPIAMANIWGMDEVLEDRAITTILEKSDNPSKTKKIEDFERNDTISYIKRTLSVVGVVLCQIMTKNNIEQEWNNYINKKYNDITTYTTHTTHNNTQQHYNINLTDVEIIKERKELMKEQENLEFFNKIDELDLNGRNLELMFPLIVVTNLLDEKVFKKICLIVKETTESKKEEEFTASKDIGLFDFISTLDKYRFQEVSLKQLTREFRIFLGEEDDKDDRWVNEKWMGKAIRRLNLSSSKRRLASGRFYILNIDKAKEKVRMFKKEENDPHNPNIPKP